MIISQTPLRISIVGGGSDLKDFYSKYSGAVLSATIDKYIYVIIKERFDDLIYINYSKREVVENINDIKHELIRETLIKSGIEKGVEITTLADIPSAGSGLGSSSSVTVGLLNAFYAYTGKQVTPEQLARDACEIEIDICGKPIGKQDQYIVAYGGVRIIVFDQDDTVTVNRVNFNNDGRRVFGSNLLLFNTNITRKADSILSEQTREMKKNYEILKQMRDQVSIAREILESNHDYRDVGNILKDAWENKKQLTRLISNKVVDEMYEKAISAGAIGGKIAGAGGGGFLLLYVPREYQNAVRQSLKGYHELPFMLELDGSKIIFNIRRSC